MLKEKIGQNEHAMELTPKVAQGLDILIRDRDSAQRKFDEIRNRKMNAQIAQNLESENKSERFTLLEPPILPEKPFKPDRIKIFAIGFLLALGSAVGVAVLLDSIDKRIRGAEALTHVLGYQPLVVIPFLHIEEESARKRKDIREIIAALWNRSKSSWLNIFKTR
jgi:capsular polysaccharide biosynthesis protein